MGKTLQRIREFYIPDMRWWQDTGVDLPTNLSNNTGHIVTIGDYIYIFGGNTAAPGSGHSTVIMRALKTAPTAWSNVGNVATAVGRAHAVIIGDYVYLIGGSIAPGETSATVIQRAPLSNPTSWSNVGNLPTAMRWSQAAILPDGYVYLFGGFTTGITDQIWRAPLSNPVSGWAAAGNTGFSVRDPQLFVTNEVLAYVGGFTGAVSNGEIAGNPRDGLQWDSNINGGSGMAYANHTAPKAVVGRKLWLVGGSVPTPTNDIMSADITSPFSWVTGGFLPGVATAGPLGIFDGHAYLFGFYNGSISDGSIWRTKSRIKCYSNAQYDPTDYRAVPGIMTDGQPTALSMMQRLGYEPWRYDVAMAQL